MTMTPEELAAAIEETLAEIGHYKQLWHRTGDIEAKRKMRDLQYKQIWHMALCERLREQEKNPS